MPVFADLLMINDSLDYITKLGVEALRLSAWVQEVAARRH